ncbi:MAG: monogalactosyldiacylglycerol synthase [Verrucomicrobia bacterium]|nr:monogalactosyldiacylglycerol synthase [Verrucomicrobiota bacterium]
MKSRILILTAGFGEGHNAAARNLEEAFNQVISPGAAMTADIFSMASPRLNRVLRKGYIGMINRTPHLWSRFYQWVDRSEILPSALWSMWREMELLAQVIRRERPVAVCSTYPVYAFMMERLAHQGRIAPVPHFNIVTDSISINSLWWRAQCDAWFVPNDASAEIMRSVGVEASRLHACGFPTPAFFRDNPNLTPPPLSRPPHPARAPGAPRVLYIINSGTRGAELTARLLLEESGWDITCAVGKDVALRRRLQKLATSRTRPTSILGWTDLIPRLLLTHHVVISKAGGATTQEAIAARCPMIVNQIVPGQEEGNYELLRRHGVGALAETPTAVLEACRSAFADQGRVWSKWRGALDRLARPNAAEAIVEQVLERVRVGAGIGAGALDPAANRVPLSLKPAAVR